MCRHFFCLLVISSFKSLKFLIFKFSFTLRRSGSSVTFRKQTLFREYLSNTDATLNILPIADTTTLFLLGSKPPIDCSKIPAQNLILVFIKTAATSKWPSVDCCDVNLKYIHYSKLLTVSAFATYLHRPPYRYQRSLPWQHNIGSH
jgi:hypothetical protein